MLSGSAHQQPLMVFLKGVDHVLLEALLLFLYHGEVSIEQERVQQFMVTAQDWGVEGLVRNVDVQNEKDDKNMGMSAYTRENIKTEIGGMFTVVKHQETKTTETKEEVDAVKYDTENSSLDIHSDISPVLICKLCDQHFTHGNILRKHMKSKHARRQTYKCEVCNEAFAKKMDLKNHHADIHINNIPNRKPARDVDGRYPCQICGKRISDYSNYIKHYNRIHLRTIHQCDQCDFRTTDKPYLKTHMMKGTCNKTF
jgi:hypothetical protein